MTKPAPASFEDALKDLEAIVRKLESGQGGLEAAIAEYERGTELKAFCDAKLKEARLKVEKILTTQGTLTTAPLD